MNSRMSVEGFERQKKFQAIAEIARLLHSSLSINDLCESICITLNKSLRYPEKTIVRIQIGTTSCSSSRYIDTPWKITKSFITPDNSPGLIEICYQSEKEWTEESPFLKEYKSLIDKISILISGSITREDFEHLLLENIERNKELTGIDRVNQILRKDVSFDALLQEICNVLPASWKHPECAGARITYDNKVFSTCNFKETPWVQLQTFQVPGGSDGTIAICYTQEFSEEDEGPFLKEERSFLENIAHLLSSTLGCRIRDQIVYENKERIKELTAINQTTAIIMKGIPIHDTLQGICNILPDSWQFPEHAAAKITFENREYVSRQFVETPFVQREQFTTIDNQIGTVEVYYLKELPEYAEGPFLKEERELLCNIARLIAHYINNEKGRRILNTIGNKPVVKNRLVKTGGTENDICDTLIGSIGVQKADYVIRNVLVVSSVQDAYLLAAESHDFQPITDPYHHHNTWYAPNIRFSSSIDHAEIQLETNHFDLVFIIASSSNQDLTSGYKALKSKYPEIQLFVVTKSPEQTIALQTVLQKEGQYKTSVFSYQDNPKLIIVLCKLYEDYLNCDQVVAPTIMLVEDKPEFYTPVILAFYSSLFSKLRMKSTNNTVNDVRIRMLLTCNYEDSVHTALLHSRSLVAVFSDIEFHKNGNLYSDAGFDFYEIIKEYSANVRFILHSTEQSTAAKAEHKEIEWLFKGSPSFPRKLCELVQKMHVFQITSETDNKSISVDNFESFLDILAHLSPTQVIELPKDTDFLNWLKVQGLFDCAFQITSAYKSGAGNSELYDQIYSVLLEVKKKDFCPPIVNIGSKDCLTEKVITTVSTGSMGGKGRNITFLHSLTSNNSIFNTDSKIKIEIPVTLIIRSDEYERILEKEHIAQSIKSNNFENIQNSFDSTELSDEVISALRVVIEKIDSPLAVRSSSLFEDSATRPFAGTFETYIIPNSNPDPSERLQQLIKAIKRIYASPFKPEAQLYYSYIGKKADEDRMAIVLQKLVGTKHGSFYYPQISGVAGSYNFYPVAHMNSDDGFSVMALGLGFFVVEGRGGHRFSPAYPGIDFGSTKDLLKGSQTQFYAVDLSKEFLDFNKYGEKAGLKLLDIDIAENHGTLNHCASTYDYTNDRIVPGISLQGPRVIDFADILKYGYLPLAEVLKSVLIKLSSCMGSPVEIEFAVNNCNKTIKNPTLHLLQVRPLTGEQLGNDIDISSVDRSKCILYSQTSLGNGIIDTLTDLVVMNLDNFDPSKTYEMVNEVEYFNRLQISNERSYIIIGPGRWGTRDKSLGIPVTWSQICNARVVVEIGLNNFPLDASLGSHFFHNITVMKTGYIAVNNTRSQEFISWDAFSNMQCIESLRFFKLLRSKKPLIVQLDGKNKQAIITRD